MGKLARLTGLMLLSLILVACGGGGAGSSDDGGGSTNTAPSVSDDSASVDENSSVKVDVLANDSDDDGRLDASTVTVTSGPSNGTTSVDSSTGEITYTPDTDFTGSDSFDYTVDDDRGAASNAAMVDVTVTSVDDGGDGDSGTGVTISEITLPDNGEVVAASASPHDPSIVIASTKPTSVGQPGTGIFRSTNGGDNWELVREGPAPVEFHFSRSNENTVLATGPGETDDEAVPDYTYLSSSDAGASWGSHTVADPTLGDALSATRVYVDPVDETEQFFVSRDAIGGGVYRSANSGDSWKRVVESGFDLAFMAEVVSPIEAPDTVFLISRQAGAKAILKSVDNGNSFNQATNGIDTSTVDFLETIGVSRNARKLTVSGHLSVNGGANWTEASVTGADVFAKGAIWQIRKDEIGVSEDDGQSWSVALTGEFPAASGSVSGDAVSWSRAYRETIHYFQAGSFEEGRLFVVDIEGYSD